MILKAADGGSCSFYWGVGWGFYGDNINLPPIDMATNNIAHENGSCLTRLTETVLVSGGLSAQMPRPMIMPGAFPSHNIIVPAPLRTIDEAKMEDPITMSIARRHKYKLRREPNE